jgi:hypothetical protein
MGGSEAATCLEKVIYSMASTVVRTPTEERRTPVYTVRTPMVGPGPPRRPGQKEPEPRNRTELTENRNRTNRTEGTVMKFGSGFLRTEINETFSVLHSKEPKKTERTEKPVSTRFNLLHVFVNSNVVFIDLC